MLGIRVSTEGAAKLSLLAATIRSWPLYLNSLAWAGGAGWGGLVSLAVIVSCISVAFSSRKQGSARQDGRRPAHPAIRPDGNL